MMKNVLTVFILIIGVFILTGCYNLTPQQLSSNIYKCETQHNSKACGAVANHYFIESNYNKQNAGRLKYGRLSCKYGRKSACDLLAREGQLQEKKSSNIPQKNESSNIPQKNEFSDSVKEKWVKAGYSDYVWYQTLEDSGISPKKMQQICPKATRQWPQISPYKYEGNCFTERYTVQSIINRNEVIASDKSNMVIIKGMYGVGQSISGLFKAIGTDSVIFTDGSSRIVNIVRKID